MTNSFDLDVDVVRVSAPTLATAKVESARNAEEMCSCTPGTVNTYTVGVFDCPTCC